MRCVFTGMTRTSLVLLLLTLSLSETNAGQSLIPAPFPNAAPGVQPLDPEPQEFGGPQKLARDPYPQILGDNAQGNPSVIRRHRHQHLVPSINQRKYRVDQVPQYY